MYSNCNSVLHGQRGATLVLALIVVLIVVALATRIGKDYFVLQRTLEYQNEQDQARAYLRGAEGVAKQALLLDLQSGSTTDSAVEPWAKVQKVPLTEGLLTVCLLDLQSRLNLNDLGAPAANGYSAAQKRFIRLLQVVQPEHPLDAASATAIANAVFDWVDADNESRNPGGAEAIDYLEMGRDYRPANQGFTSVSELALVAGIDADLAAALTPFVTVWGNGTLNVNTADSKLLWSAQAGMNDDDKSNDNEPVMLRTLGSSDTLRPLTPEAAHLIADVRTHSGAVFKSLSAFRQLPLAQVPWDLDGLDVASDYFQMSADMQTGPHHYRLLSVLARTRDAANRPQVTVKSRTWLTGTTSGGIDCAAPYQ
ncbi:MAG TPA: type II secretion system minor pseudopilin GspK [Candidatus Acidoferrum sp.]|nr:type II secretion system minor pseudopilin GspK [Candidatus Acidoferrum sp.]